MGSSSKERVTLLDVARHLGISQSTVSRALQDDPRITAAVRRQAQRAAQELGYQRDPMATAFARYRWDKDKAQVGAALAWINCWPDPKQLRTYREFDGYWKGAAAEAERNGYRLEEFACDKSLPLPRLEKILLTRNIRGVLIPPHHAVPEWGDFHWEKFCVVRFGHGIDTPRAHLVTSDQVLDSLTALDAMRQRGYRRIGLVALETNVRRRLRFTAGYLFGQLEDPLDLRLPPLLLPANNAEERLRQFQAWLKANRPDAILTEEADVRDMLGQLGYRVPQDIGLAALSVLDGNADAGIYQNPEEIGCAAVQLLLTLIHHHERGIPQFCREVLVEGSWVDGRTLPVRKN